MAARVVSTTGAQLRPTDGIVSRLRKLVIHTRTATTFAVGNYTTAGAYIPAQSLPANCVVDIEFGDEDAVFGQWSIALVDAEWASAYYSVGEPG